MILHPPQGHPFHAATVFRGDEDSWAIFSPCETMRYVLGRRLSHAPLLAFVLLNPSTADEIELDPTLRRCIDFAANMWGYGGMIILNAYALRTKDPKLLPRVKRMVCDSAIGPENNFAIGHYTKGRDVLVGWGNHCSGPRMRMISQIISSTARTVECLEINKNGSPTHPLYLRKDSVRKPWAIPSYSIGSVGA